MRYADAFEMNDEFSGLDRSAEYNKKSNNPSKNTENQHDNLEMIHELNRIVVPTDGGKDHHLNVKTKETIQPHIPEAECTVKDAVTLENKIPTDSESVFIKPTKIPFKRKLKCKHAKKNYEANVNISGKFVLDYKCDHCKFVATNISDLSAHRVAKHQDILYSCDNCLFTSKKRRDLKLHLLQHHIVKKAMSCSHCKFISMNYYEMKYHSVLHNETILKF